MYKQLASKRVQKQASKHSSENFNNNHASVIDQIQKIQIGNNDLARTLNRKHENS